MTNVDNIARTFDVFTMNGAYFGSYDLKIEALFVGYPMWIYSSPFTLKLVDVCFNNLIT